MAGNAEGARKAARTIRMKHGDNFYGYIGQLGGRAGTGHKFAHGKITAHEAGKLGGRPTKRRKI